MLALLVVLVQVVAGAVASFLVGMLWYSPAMFGRVWWRYEFPGKPRYGETETNSNFPLYCTTVAMVIQSAVLTFLINAILFTIDPSDLNSLPVLSFPLLVAATIATVVACASFPHYLFAGKPLPLFLICSSHDTLQIAAAVFLIYALA